MGSGRTGILGGTFDPVHLGHHDVAVAARLSLALDRVLLIPSRIPPHRTQNPTASASDRLAMVELAAAYDRGLEASDLELRSKRPSFTSLTLAELGTTIAPGNMFFITGADAFADIASWRNYPGLLDQSHFVVVSRPGHPVEALAGQLPDLSSRMTRASDESSGLTPTTNTQTSIWLVDSPTRAISSSEIRIRLDTGKPVDGLVQPSVADYIYSHQLYGPPSDAPLHV